jgi:hypothetical protein
VKSSTFYSPPLTAILIDEVESEMLKVDLRNLSRGGLILSALAILAMVVVMAVLLWAAPEGFVGRGRGEVLIALGGLASALLVWAAGSMLLNRLGVPILRPEAPQELSPEEATARLLRKAEEYRRLWRLLRWTFITMLGSTVVFFAAVGLMLITKEKWVLWLGMAAAAPMVVLLILVMMLAMRQGLWLCPTCGREFGRQRPFGSALHKCQHCGHAIELT